MQQKISVTLEGSKWEAILHMLDIEYKSTSFLLSKREYLEKTEFLDLDKKYAELKIMIQSIRAACVDTLIYNS